MADPAATPDSPVEAAAARLAAASRILVLSGAGISAESGIPTFRGRGGWWRNEDPSRLATPEAFRADPAHVWEWYQYRRQLVRDAVPNAAHRAVAGWASDGREVLVDTQNVDDLHERAGSGAVVHIHGSIWRVRCFRCDAPAREDRTVPFETLPPTCDACGGPLRPDVVWFGETLPAAPFRAMEGFLAGGVDLALVVGTEATFGYIRALALAAREAGAALVEVNPSPTTLSDEVDIRIEGAAGSVLPALTDGVSNTD
ncbi:MAG TPA: NAD-dependent protein deacylase [Longimicrobiales bacterium]|nr:NAD-dependent protein deacylase [Longimicrobiales bacterium]